MKFDSFFKSWTAEMVPWVDFDNARILWTWYEDEVASFLDGRELVDQIGKLLETLFLRQSIGQLVSFVKFELDSLSSLPASSSVLRPYFGSDKKFPQKTKA